ncbi:MAG: butyrate kinase [Kiritimatiellae bacterium]|nr:butyrate kinase [Kiritimatiellia bacterium]MDD5520285.1 butyrate kinase [Kiritimatiellia bacterium]
MTPPRQDFVSAITISEFQNIAASLPPRRVFIAGGDREEDISLYTCLREKPFVKQCVLVGDEKKMKRAAEKADVQIAASDIISTSSQEETAARIKELARNGQAEIIQKGNISTPILNRQLVKIRTRDTMSLVTVFQADCISDGRTMIMTDSGVSAILNYSRMTGLINNAAEIAHSVLKLRKPRIALLSGNEKVIPALPSTVMADELAKAYWKNAIVYGPLSFDLAVDRESVRVKLPNLTKGTPIYEVAGKADILVNPGLDAANIMYKMLMRLVVTNTASMACVTVGIKAPYIISSRSDPEKTKIDSIALSCIYANYLQKKKNIQIVKHADTDLNPTFTILAINPGSTSTKLALFENATCLQDFEVPHKHKAGLHGKTMDSEVELYAKQIKEFLGKHINKKIDAIVGRGGFLNRQGQRISSGAYKICTVVNKKIKVEHDIISGVRDYAEMDHASNLGIPIAARLAKEYMVPAYSVDPVVVDEFQTEARYSGYAPIERRNVGHVLSIRAAARKAAETVGLPFDKSSFVVAHLGGGISVAAVKHGKIIDSTIALLGEGPFTPQRAGTLPQKDLIDLCYSGKFTREELNTELTKNAGLISYLNEDSLLKIEERIANGDTRAEEAVDAMTYRIAKEIGAMNIVLGNAANAIVLAGGIARSELVAGKITKRVGNLAQIIIFKQNLEMEALATGALHVLLGQEEPLKYKLPAKLRN